MASQAPDRQDDFAIDTSKFEGLLSEHYDDLLDLISWGEYTVMDFTIRGQLTKIKISKF